MKGEKLIFILTECIADSYDDVMAFLEKEDEFKNAVFAFFPYSELAANVAGCGTQYKEVCEKIKKKKYAYTVIPDCYSMEQFFCLYPHVPVYIAPTKSKCTIYAASFINYDYYKGKDFKDCVYSYKVSAKNGGYTDEKANLKRGNKVEDVESDILSVSYNPGENCYFQYKKNKYIQRIKNIDDADCAQGQEGYTFTCDEDNEIRIKLWHTDFYRERNNCIKQLQDDCEKIAAMISLPNKKTDIALPLAFVKNNKGENIGYVMPNYPNCDAKLFPDGGERRFSVSAKCIEQIFWMAVHSIIHRDIYNNIICDEDLTEAHVIDCASVQFSTYHARARDGFETSEISYLPKIFESTEKLGIRLRSAVISQYYALQLVLDIYSEEYLNASCLIEGGSEEDWKKLEEKNPVLCHAARRAYTQRVVPSFEELLVALYQLMGKKDEIPGEIQWENPVKWDIKPQEWCPPTVTEKTTENKKILKNEEHTKNENLSQNEKTSENKTTSEGEEEVIKEKPEKKPVSLSIMEKITDYAKPVVVSEKDADNSLGLQNPEGVREFLNGKGGVPQGCSAELKRVVCSKNTNEENLSPEEIQLVEKLSGMKYTKRKLSLLKRLICFFMLLFRRSVIKRALPPLVPQILQENPLLAWDFVSRTERLTEACRSAQNRAVAKGAIIGLFLLIASLFV